MEQKKDRKESACHFRHGRNTCNVYGERTSLRRNTKTSVRRSIANGQDDGKQSSPARSGPGSFVELAVEEHCQPETYTVSRYLAICET